MIREEPDRGVVRDKFTATDELAGRPAFCRIRVEIAENGRRALEKVTNEEFDLIFCDIRMPDLDGPGRPADEPIQPLFIVELRRAFPEIQSLHCVPGQAMA